MSNRIEEATLPAGTKNQGRYTNNLEGIVINPAGEWIEIGAEEIKTMLNTAK